LRVQVALASRRVTASPGERLRSAAVLLLALCALCILYLFNPATTSFYPTCPFFWATGCYCPGCGSLRALHQLTHGHLLAALGLNPLMVLSLPFLGYAAISQARLAVLGNPLKSVFVGPWHIWALLVLVLAYWVLRNVPAYPFSLLAP
jgi:Protein of unknown function (DUF2752)